MKKFLVLLLVLSLTIPLFACVVGGNESSNSDYISSEESALSLQIELPYEELTLSVGRTAQLEPIITGAKEDDDVIYVSLREQVASVDRDGKITALKPGDTEISVTVRDVTASIMLTVVFGANGIKLASDSALLAVGDTLSLEATVEPEDVLDKEVFFRSLNEEVATIDENGLISALTKGEATIEAYTANGKTAQCLVTVRPVAESIELDKAEIQLKEGGSATLSAKILPEDALAEKAVFTSDNESVAVVDQNGVITAKTVGSTKIMVSAGDITAECLITVTETPKVVEVTTVKLDKGNSTLTEGATLKLTATVLPSNANDKRITFSSSNKSVATVDSKGLVTAVKKGSAFITAAATNGKKASITVTVEELNLTEKPVVQTYVYTESDVFVVLGKCEQNATIKVTDGNSVITTKSDHGYFSARVKNNSSTVDIKITASVPGKGESPATDYRVTRKAPNTSKGSNYWGMIPGDDYQFHMRDYNYLDDYLRTNSFSENNLSRIKTNINAKVANVRKYNPNAQIIYVVVPSGAAIYPETMPEYYTPRNNPSRLEQLYGVIEDSDAVLIDLKKVFTEHKNDDLKLYWKTDTHWTDYGAFVAYTEMFNYIKQTFPDAAPRKMSEFDFVEDYYEWGDVAENLGLRSSPLQIIDFKEYNALRVPKFDMPSSISSIKRYVSDRRLTYNPATVQDAKLINTNRSNLPNLLVMCDSYVGQMYDILAERGNSTQYAGMWNFGISTRHLESLKPDFVIFLLVERNLGNIVN